MTRDEATAYTHTLTCGHKFAGTAAFLGEVHCGHCAAMRGVEEVNR